MTPAAHQLLRALYLHALAPSTANQDAVRAAGATLDTETGRKLNGPRDAPNEAATLNAGPPAQILISAVGDDDAQWGWQVWDDVGDLSAEGVVPSLAVALAQVAGVVNAPRSPAPVDTIVAEVRADLLARSEVGIAKYGVTLDRTDLGHAQWLQHGYEEALDLACYLKRAMRDVTDDAAYAGHPLSAGDLAALAALQADLERKQAARAEAMGVRSPPRAPVEPPHAAVPALRPLTPEPAEAVLGRAREALAGSLPVYVLAGTGRHPYGDDAWHMETDGVARLFPSKEAAHRWLAAMGKAPASGEAVPAYVTAPGWVSPGYVHPGQVPHPYGELAYAVHVEGEMRIFPTMYAAFAACPRSGKAA